MQLSGGVMVATHRAFEMRNKVGSVWNQCHACSRIRKNSIAKHRILANSATLIVTSHYLFSERVTAGCGLRMEPGWSSPKSATPTGGRAPFDASACTPETQQISGLSNL